MDSLMSPSGYDYNSKIRYRSEVDWGPRAVKQSQPPTVEPRSWDCGDVVKKKELVERFGQVSSVHGTVYIFSKEKVSACTRIFYKSLFVMCLIMVVTNTSTILQTAWSSESSYMNNINKASTIGKEEDPEFFPIYPRITLCRKPPYKTNFNSSYQELVEYVTLALGYPFTNWTPEEVSFVFSVLMSKVSEQRNVLGNPAAEEFYGRLEELEIRFKELKDPNFDIKKFIVDHSIRCEDVFSSCQAMVFSYNCCDLFQPVLTTLGLCYTLHSTDFIERLQTSLSIDFSLVLDLFSPESTEKMTEFGFQVFLTDPREETYMFEGFEGQKIVPGSATTISVQLMKSDRQELYAQWYGVSRCPKLPFGDRTERYSPATCNSYYMFQSLRESCNCESILTRSGTFSSLRFCDPLDQYECFILKILQSNRSDIADGQCPDPCVLYTFKNEASYIGLGGENVSRIEIMYDSKHYIFHEFKTFTFSGLFSQIGGVLGLYMGASIITVVEMICFFFSWIWYTCVPSRSSRVQPSHLKPYSIHLPA